VKLRRTTLCTTGKFTTIYSTCRFLHERTSSNNRCHHRNVEAREQFQLHGSQDLDTFYGRFCDDLNSIISNKQRAQLMCNLIENQDPDHLSDLQLTTLRPSVQAAIFVFHDFHIEEGGILARRPPMKKLTR
jgi:hypothetical protein